MNRSDSPCGAGLWKIHSSPCATTLERIAHAGGGGVQLGALLPYWEGEIVHGLWNLGLGQTRLFMDFGVEGNLLT